MEEIMGYRIGFDIGSTTIKAVVLDENNQICYKSYERHKAQVRQKALDKLVELKKYTKEPFKFAISGSGALGLSEQGELPFVQDEYKQLHFSVLLFLIYYIIACGRSKYSLPQHK